MGGFTREQAELSVRWYIAGRFVIPALVAAASANFGGMVDSSLASTRVFWRKKYYAATDAEANDPRPFAEVLRERASCMNAPSPTITIPEAPMWLDWHSANDPVIRRYFGDRYFDLAEATVSDLGARIVAEALADMFDHLYDTLSASPVAHEHGDLLTEYSEAEGALRSMAYGEDDEAEERYWEYARD